MQHTPSHYAGRSGHRATSIAVVVAMHGAAIAAALLIQSGAIQRYGPEAIQVVDIPPEPAPPPEQPPEQVEPQVPLPAAPIRSVNPIDLPVPPLPVIDADLDIAPTPPVEPAPPAPEPALVPARFDPSARGAIQPAYPSALLRSETEGSVTVRVRIATNGRVTAVELVRTDHPRFFEATRRHALRHWRFEPATRDGRPVESWQQHTVLFQIR